MTTLIRSTMVLLLALALTACGQHYVTPGGGVALLEITDDDLKSYYETRPTAPFPTSIAVVRVQDSGYRSLSLHGYGQGRFSVVTTRDIETDESYEKLAKLPLVADVAPIGRMLVPVNANTIKDLRVPAAKLHADMVLIYSVDTAFTVDGKSLGPLSTVSLGLIPNKKAHVTSTVAGVLIDVRTGHIYGTTEASDLQQQRATIWSTQQAIETARLRAEKNAFKAFVGEFEDLWSGVLASRYTTPAADGNNPPRGRTYDTVKFWERE